MLKRKRVKNIKLTDSKSYDDATLRVKLYICGTGRCLGQNCGPGKPSSSPEPACMAQALHPLSDKGVQCWQHGQH